MLYKTEVVQGVANQRVYGRGLTSSEAERYRLRRVYIKTSAQQGNSIEFWFEKERFVDVVDNVIRTTDLDWQASFDIDREIPVGRTIRPALLCGANPTTIYVLYEYEITG